MKIERVILRKAKMRLLQPFRTSFGVEQDKEFIIVQLEGEGLTGWSECVAMDVPFYSYETVVTAWSILKEYLVPLVLEKPLDHPREIMERAGFIRGHQMAKAAMECALWDFYARSRGESLAQALGGSKDQVEVGVSVGIQPTVDDLLNQVEGFLEEGYRKIKVKIEPGNELKPLAAIRERFGDIPLMADANSAYSLDDIDILKQLDQFDLIMIEQPLAYDDIFDHAKLQAQLDTPVCLDESVHSLRDAEAAVELGACQIINIKIGRVGGLAASKDIHDFCLENGIDVWCGGMLESGIGRCFNLAIASLPGFKIPGDTSGSDRYWQEDIIDPPVTMAAPGLVTVPTGLGLGHRVRPERIEEITEHEETFTQS